MKSVLHQVAIASCAFLVTCGGGENTAVDPGGIGCVTITGNGKTTGNTNVLRGGAKFAINSVESDVEVGLYLFQIIPFEDGGFRVKTQYQFLWPNGDSFLTADWVLFDPTLRPDEFTFTVDMTIASGTGIFRQSVGKKPIGLNALIIFSDPVDPADARVANETFNLSGNICQ